MMDRWSMAKDQKVSLFLPPLHPSLFHVSIHEGRRTNIPDATAIFYPPNKLHLTCGFFYHLFELTTSKFTRYIVG
ncbi:hypothetical protein Hanom_Chr15g01382061 [Helianthus anomalus]